MDENKQPNQGGYSPNYPKQLLPSDEYWGDPIQVLDSVLHRLAETPIPDDILVDVVGDVAATHRRLGAWLRDQRAELGPDQEGERWRSIERRKADRSYNTNGLLSAFANALPGGQSPLGALKRLLERDVIRLEWRWTELVKAAEQDDVTLVIANHEIGDGDPEVLVGQVWSRRVALQPVEDGEVIT